MLPQRDCSKQISPEQRVPLKLVNPASYPVVPSSFFFLSFARWPAYAFAISDSASASLFAFSILAFATASFLADSRSFLALGSGSTVGHLGTFTISHFFCCWILIGKINGVKCGFIGWRTS